MKKTTIRNILDLVIASILTAIIIVMSLVPNAGFIHVGVVSITIVHIPVLIGVLLLPLAYAIFLGFVFGMGSMIASFMYASTPIDLAFHNPLVSVLPRILFALAAFFILRGFILTERKVKFGKIIVFFIVVATLLFLFAYAPNVLSSSYYDLTKPENLAKTERLYTILNPVFAGVSILFLTFYYYMSKRNSKIDEIIMFFVLSSLLVFGSAYLPNVIARAVHIGEIDKIRYLTNVLRPCFYALTLVILTGFYASLYKFKNNEPMDNIKENTMSIPSAIIISTLIHTLLVLGSLRINHLLGISNLKEYGSATFYQFLEIVIGSNGTIEILAATLIATPIIIAIREIFPAYRFEKNLFSFIRTSDKSEVDQKFFREIK